MVATDAARTPSDAPKPNAPGPNAGRADIAPRLDPAELQARLAAVLPTDEEVAEYRRRGYYRSRALFTPEEIAAARQAQDEYYADRYDADDLVGREWPGWRPEDGEVMRKSDFSSFRKVALAAIVRSPLVGAVAARLAGATEIRLWHDQLLYKPVEKAGVVARVGWHTDKSYWRTCSSNGMLTAWVPFHDCDERMGTIMMIEGSNVWAGEEDLRGFFSNDLDAQEAAMTASGRKIVKAPVELKAGEASFHSCLTIHGSGPNHGTEPRRSIAIHLQDAPNRFVPGATFPDGARASHENDLLVRLDAEGNPDYTDPIVCPRLWPL